MSDLLAGLLKRAGCAEIVRKLDVQQYDSVWARIKRWFKE